MAEKKARDLVSPDLKRVAEQKAKDRAKIARWDLNIAIFLFAVLILVLILVTYTRMGIEAVAPIAAFGLGMVWLEGWRRERQLFQRFYEEELQELANQEQESKKTMKEAVKETIEETIEEQVQKALRQRWQR